MNDRTADHDESQPPLQDRTAWLDQYRPWLEFLARVEIDSRFQGKHSASDVVQQTMLAAWKGWDQFRGEHEQQRLAWLRSILAHELAHVARRYGQAQMRAVNRELSIDQSLARSAGRLADLLADDATSPSQHAMRNEQELLLTKVLGEMPDEYRQVLIGRHFDDKSHAEIAAELGRSEGAVRMLWMRALKLLKQRLDEHEA